jgi:hypothetical protein
MSSGEALFRMTFLLFALGVAAGILVAGAIGGLIGFGVAGLFAEPLVRGCTDRRKATSPGHAGHGSQLVSTRCVGGSGRTVPSDQLAAE